VTVFQTVKKFVKERSVIRSYYNLSGGVRGGGFYYVCKIWYTVSFLTLSAKHLIMSGQHGRGGPRPITCAQLAQQFSNAASDWQHPPNNPPEVLNVSSSSWSSIQSEEGRDYWDTSNTLGRITLLCCRRISRKGYANDGISFNEMISERMRAECEMRLEKYYSELHNRQRKKLEEINKKAGGSCGSGTWGPKRERGARGSGAFGSNRV
jgi:hypothetical protein